MNGGEKKISLSFPPPCSHHGKQREEDVDVSTNDIVGSGAEANKVFKVWTLLASHHVNKLLRENERRLVSVKASKELTVAEELGKVDVLRRR